MERTLLACMDPLGEDPGVSHPQRTIHLNRQLSR
jgi:hypothetical protein